MAETSYIIQNGKRLNLKDAAARSSIGSCDELKTEAQHCLVHAINELAEKIEASSSGVDFTTDDTLTLKNGVLSVNTADKVEDNTLPITAAAVNTTVGNIEILLKTI
jgi:hypothetical protein